MFSGEFRFVSESVNPAKKARQRRVNLRVPEGGDSTTAVDDGDSVHFLDFHKRTNPSVTTAS